MEKENIGINAGKIWQILNNNSKLNISELKKISKLDQKELYLALGWLAREDKVYFIEGEKELSIGIINVTYA